MNQNEQAAGELHAMLIKIYTDRLKEMAADSEKMNVSLLKEAREFLKQHDISLDANSAPMQDLSAEVSELETFRAAQAARRGSSS
jgi:hemerythrin